MNASTLKVLVPLVLLIAVVFAVTFFSQYTVNDPVEIEGSKNQSADKPLHFFSNVRHWDPRPVGDDGVTPPSLQDRIFPGFYEADGTRNPAQFWFENRNPKPVRMQLAQASCSTCSAARLAPIPPDVARAVLQMSAAAALPQGLIPGIPLGMVGPAAYLDPRRDTLRWRSYVFKDRDPAEVVFDVPAAGADPWSPQWGILELSFQAKPPSGNIPFSVRTAFTSKVEGSDQSDTEQFIVAYESVPPFVVDTSLIEIGELTDSSPDQTHEFLVYSSTREQMPDLTIQVMMPVGVAGEPGGFIRTGTPTPLGPAELTDLAAALSQKGGKPVRVRSAYRVPVTVKVRDGNAKLDIGRVARAIWITQGSEQKQVAVVGSMRGSVYLKEEKEVNLGTFPYTQGTTTTATVITERRGVDLALTPDLTRPKYLQVQLKKLPDREENGEYELTVKVPGREDAAIGEIVDGVVVLEVRGPSPQRIRIPVKGKGQR